VDMICRELMLDEEKTQTPKRPRTKKKKGGSKTVSQPADDTTAGAGASSTSNSCLVRHHIGSHYLSVTPKFYTKQRVQHLINAKS